MTSEERRELRYQRRCKKRADKRKQKNPYADDFRQIYSFANLWRSYKNCRKNVGWKGSVQRYTFDAPIRVSRVYRTLMQGRYKCATPHEWDTYERGKPRHIKSVPIGERVVQRCIADNSLVPVLTPMYIYDNGACLKNKGYGFAMDRLCTHLHQYYRKHGQEGYALVFDFSKFYDNIDHDLVRKILRSRLSDGQALKMVDDIMATFGDTGLGLGSQISQILALASGNALDHCIKQELGIRFYARYNDDGYLLHPDKDYLRKCLNRIKEVCEACHIKLNEKKTQIVKISHGFKFLKTRVYLLPTGKVLRKISKKRITVVRRKLKKLKKKLTDGTIDLKHIEMSYQSWRAYAKKYFQAWHTVCNMDQLFHALYPEGKICT